MLGPKGFADAISNARKVGLAKTYKDIEKQFKNIVSGADKTKSQLEEYLEKHNLTEKRYLDRRPGDIYFWYHEGNCSHAGMVSTDTWFHVHSIFKGVTTEEVDQDTMKSVVFRLKSRALNDKWNQKIAYKAAETAMSWEHKTGYSKELEIGKEGDVAAPKRQTRVLIGSSSFDSSAMARFQKYVRRNLDYRTAGHDAKLNPKNVTCGEMVILAYQIAVGSSNKPYFIRLDPRHTTPTNFMRYLLASEHWEFVGWRNKKNKNPSISELRCRLAVRNVSVAVDPSQDNILGIAPMRFINDPGRRGALANEAKADRNRGFVVGDE